MGVQASIIPEAFSWLNCCAVFTRRGEPISPVSFGQVAKIRHTCVDGSGIYCHLPELQRSKAQSEGCIWFIYSWSCAEDAASEESGKESCVIKLAIEGSIGIGSITQHNIFKMAAKNAAIYNSAGNTSISTKFSGIIPVVILSHFELSENRSCDLAAMLDILWKCHFKEVDLAEKDVTILWVCLSRMQHGTPPCEHHLCSCQGMHAHSPGRSIGTILILDTKEAISLSVHSDWLRQWYSLGSNRQNSMVCTNSNVWTEPHGMGSDGPNSRVFQIKWPLRYTHLMFQVYVLPGDVNEETSM